MVPDTFAERVLNDFVFADSRLGSHTSLYAQVLWLDSARSTKSSNLEISVCPTHKRDVGAGPDQRNYLISSMNGE